MVEDNPLRKALAGLEVPTVMAFGNPLLDILVNVKDTDILKKYDLTVDGETELPSEKMQELLADLSQELMSWNIKSVLEDQPRIQ